MHHVGELYYNRAIKYFELGEYEQAIMDFIHSYECGYERDLIINNIYNCFVLPNEKEFQANYEQNHIGITGLSYEECTLDFIPVSENRFYIFDREEQIFQGMLELDGGFLDNSELSSNSVLYTDTWDIREILLEIKEEKRKHIYVLMKEMEPRFVSFFKLPNFRELYLKQMNLFQNDQNLLDFFMENLSCNLPARVVSANAEKYVDMIKEIKEKREELKIFLDKWFPCDQWIIRKGKNNLKRSMLSNLKERQNGKELSKQIKHYEANFPSDIDLYIVKAWNEFVNGETEIAYRMVKKGLKVNPFNFTLNQLARIICKETERLTEAIKYDVILMTLKNEIPEVPEVDQWSADLLAKITERVNALRSFGEEFLAEKYCNELKDIKKFVDVSFGINDYTYYWKKSYPIVKMVGTIYEDKFGNRKYNSHYGINYIEKFFPDLVQYFDNWIFVKLECLEVLSTNQVLINDDAEYLLPVLQEDNQVLFKFITPNGHEITCRNKETHNFEYYRLPPSTRLESEKDLYLGKPIALKQDPKNKKLVLNIFVDGISQKVIEEENFAELMPHTNEFFAKGIRCSQAYSAAEWTLPSLASYATGVTPAKHMVIHNTITSQLPEDLTILAEYFKEQGYQTAKIDGDWRSTQSYGYSRGMDRILYQHQCVGMRVEQVIEDTLDHIKLMQETNQFIWMCIGDLHNVADGIPQSPSVQASLPLESRAMEKVGITSVKQNHSINKRIAYMKQMKYIDDHLAVLYRYIEENYKDDEIVISLFGDHGQGYLVEDGRHFLSEGRSKVGMMFRSDLKQGTVCEELISACDYVPIMCKLAGIPLKDEPIEGRVPLFFGGEEERKYALTESLHPGDPYRAAIVSKEHVFYFTAEGIVEYDGRFELGNYQCQLFNKEGEECNDQEAMDEYLHVLMDHIGSLLIY